MRPLFIPLLLIMATVTSSARELLVYIGTYTKTTSKGIYAGRFDPETGKLGELTLAAETANPSFVALSPDRRFLYAVSEGAGAEFNGKPSGSVNAYAINPADGNLTALNSAASAGRGPCHLSVTPDGKTVLVANYSSGIVAALPVNTDGRIGAPAAFDQHEGHSIHPGRQKGPYAHSIYASADGRFAFSADLGTDKVYTYKLSPLLEPASEVALEPGSGPRHLALSADGRRAYVINELANTITTFTVDPVSGALTPLQSVSTLPGDFTGKSTTAEVVVHPNGRFVYGSNRGNDSIAIFNVSPTDGTLTPAGHVPTQGRTPRNFSLSPDGRWLIAANQDGDSLVIFSVDANTGALSPTGQKVTVGAPVCVRFY